MEPAVQVSSCTEFKWNSLSEDVKEALLHEEPTHASTSGVVDWICRRFFGLLSPTEDWLSETELKVVNVASLAKARNNAPSITTLDIRHEVADVALMQEIVRWDSLQALEVFRFADHSYTYLSKMARLSSLRVSAIDTEDRSSFFALLPKLTDLSIYGNNQRFSQEDIKALVKSGKTICELNILAVVFDLALFPNFEGLSSLTNLHVQFQPADSKVRAQAFSALASFPNLENFQIQCPREWQKDWEQEILPLLQKKMPKMKMFECDLSDPQYVHIHGNVYEE
jgi:hypothetical protein